MAHGEPAPDGLVTAPQLARRVLATLRRRWLAAVLLFSLTIAAALAVTLGKAPAYSATAQILLAPSDAIGQLVSPGSLPSPANAQRDVDTNAKLITSHPVLQAVRAELGSSASDEELAAKVEVSGQTESSLVSITVTDASVVAARRLAASLARQYARFRRANAQDAVRQAIAAGRERLDELPGSGATTEERRALQARLAELETNAAVATGGVQIVRLPGAAGGVPGSVPETLEDAAAIAARPADAAPVDNLTPRRLALTLLVAGLAGALLAIGGALAIDAKDRRLLSFGDVGAAFGVPVLGCLPARASGAAQDPDPPAVDAIADLAAGLGFAGHGGPRTLMLIPTEPRLSASAATSGLAAQLAAMRRRVLVVDANLAAAAGAPDAGAAGHGGLTAVLAGDRALGDELAVVHVVGPAADARREHAGDVSSYELLPAGEPVRNPAALLGRPVLAAIMRDALARADVVLVNAGPPSPVSQCAPLAALSDRIVLVAQLRRTTAADAEAARRTLGPLYERVAGVVVLAPDRRGPGRHDLPAVSVAPPRPAAPAGREGASNGAVYWPSSAPAGEREHV